MTPFEAAGSAASPPPGPTDGTGPASGARPADAASPANGASRPADDTGLRDDTGPADGPGIAPAADGAGPRDAPTDGPGTTPTPTPATVTIRIPADPEYLPLLRAACGHLAPRLGCSLAEIADLRLAVDEACGLLLRNCLILNRGSADDGLTAVFVIDETALRITVGMPADAFATPDDDEFGWTILNALVDGFRWRVEGSTVQVEILKKNAAGR